MLIAVVKKGLQKNVNISVAKSDWQGLVGTLLDTDDVKISRFCN